MIWRAFVYSAENNEDRAQQAYSEFKPLDGKFRDNVIVQVKNGPIDFQPREPFQPLVRRDAAHAAGMEVQVTKEYLGFNTHLAYLGTMWEEVLRSDTMRAPPTVARVIDGAGSMGANGRRRQHRHRPQLVRVAIRPGQLVRVRPPRLGPASSARAIAEEWARMTWGNDPRLVAPVVGMMMGSRQAVVDYMTPLGLAHLMATGHH